MTNEFYDRNKETWENMTSENLRSLQVEMKKQGELLGWFPCTFNNGPSLLRPEDYYALMQSVMIQNPENIICIGSVFGEAEVIFATLCASRGWGKVISIATGSTVRERFPENLKPYVTWFDQEPLVALNNLGVSPEGNNLFYVQWIGIQPSEAYEIIDLCQKHIPDAGFFLNSHICHPSFAKETARFMGYMGVIYDLHDFPMSLTSNSSFHPSGLRRRIVRERFTFKHDLDVSFLPPGDSETSKMIVPHKRIIGFNQDSLTKIEELVADDCWVMVHDDFSNPEMLIDLVEISDKYSGKICFVYHINGSERRFGFDKHKGHILFMTNHDIFTVCIVNSLEQEHVDFIDKRGVPMYVRPV